MDWTDDTERRAYHRRWWAAHFVTRIHYTRTPDRLPYCGKTRRAGPLTVTRQARRVTCKNCLRFTGRQHGEEA